MISIARPCFHVAMATVDVAPTMEAALRPRRVAGPAFADLDVRFMKYFNIKCLSGSIHQPAFSQLDLFDLVW